MSEKEKLLQRLLTDPPVKDLRWEDLVRLGSLIRAEVGLITLLRIRGDTVFLYLKRIHPACLKGIKSKPHEKLWNILSHSKARHKMANDYLKHKIYQGSIEVSIDDNCLHGRILFIDDLITYEGETIAEVTTNFIATVDRYVADCAISGKPPNKPYSGTFNVRIGAELHKKAVQAAYKRNMGLNEYITYLVQTSVDEKGLIERESLNCPDFIVSTGSQPILETRVATMTTASSWRNFHETIQ